GANRWWRATIDAHAAPYWRSPGLLFKRVNGHGMHVYASDLERFLARRQTPNSLYLALAIYAGAWTANERTRKAEMEGLEYTLSRHRPFIDALCERIRCQERDLKLEIKWGAGRLHRARYTAEDNRAWSAAQLEATRAELCRVQRAHSYVEATAAVKRIEWRRARLLEAFATVLTKNTLWRSFQALCDAERAQTKHVEELERKRGRNQGQEALISRELARLDLWRIEVVALEAEHAERAAKIARLKEEWE